jgi:hypothetical protein
VAEFVTGQFMEGTDDPERIGLLLTAQILSAETPEEVLASGRRHRHPAVPGPPV